MSSKIVAHVNHSNGRIAMQVPFEHNGFVRGLPNCRFNRRNGVWQMVPGKRAATIIRDNRTLFQFMPGVVSLLKEFLDQEPPVTGREPFPSNYPFKTEPFEHQRATLDYQWSLQHGALLMEMGTGKTKISIDLCSARQMAGQINGLVVCCPSAIRENWLDELAIHCPVEHKAMVLYQKTTKNEREIEAFLSSRHPFRVLICGTESLCTAFKQGRAYEKVQRFLVSTNSAMVVDESHLIKGHDSNRSRNIVQLGLAAKHKLIMTGTPVAQGPMDMYMQYRFLDPQIIGIDDWYSFRNRYAILGGFQNKQIVGYHHVDELVNAVKPYTFQCTKEEVLPNLPPKLYETRRIDLAPEQMKIYKRMAKERIAAIPSSPDTDYVAENILAVHLALQQIVAGFITHTDEETGERRTEILAPWEKNNKIKELVEVLSQHTGKAIIWAVYRQEIAQIVAALQHNFGGDSVAQYHGGLDPEQRAEQKNRFQRDDTVRFFVSNQSTGGTGLTLNQADLSIYFSNSFALVQRLQSEDRNHRIGQENRVLYVDLVARGTVDEMVSQAVRNKKDMADYVRDLMAEGASPVEIAQSALQVR